MRLLPWFFLLVLIWAIAYLPGLHVRDLRLEEGRRATPAREMLATGNYIVPTLFGDTYLNKPPFYCWLVAGLGKLCGRVNEVCVRLPSALSVLACALVVFAFGRRELDRQTRYLAALFVLTSVVMLDKGTLGEIDAFLTAQIGLALLLWYEGDYPTEHRLVSWFACGLLMGLMALTKGPGGPLVFYLTIVPYLAWQKRLGRLCTLGHAFAILIACVPVTVWVALVLATNRVTTTELYQLWWGQMGISTATHLVTGHVNSLVTEHFYNYPHLALTMLLPWGLFAVLRHGEIEERLRRFLLVGWIVPIAVFFVWPTGRARYAMASVLPCCQLAALAVRNLARTRRYAIPNVLTTCLLISVGSLIVWTIVMPRKARTDPARQARGDFVPPWKANETLWTTQRFPRVHDGSYNLHFYLAERCQGFTSFEQLPMDESTPVVMTMQEYAELGEQKAYRVERLHTLPECRGRTPALVIARVLRQGGRIASK